MRILLSRLSNTHHRLEIVRDDGSRESADLVSRSFLLHDLLHFAVESEAGLKEGFWGLLARGTPLAKLNDRENAMKAFEPGVELGLAESVVGPMTALVQGKIDAAGLVRAFHEQFRVKADHVPDWLTEGFVMRVMERMRRLLGQWKATRFGDRMELGWPPERQQPEH
ncbi:MAG: hypothetical protein IRZ16_15500 [Myxococcaceae bacterium]|nr:hypothetical protein [Myxococcaceae bacterium]